jgi:hypothetical protein
MYRIPEGIKIPEVKLINFCYLRGDWQDFAG